MEFWLNLSALIEKYCYLMSALQLRISLSLMRLCPCDPGEGVRGSPLIWQGWGLGVKVFRVHEGKDGPQRLGLISTVNTEKGCIPFNYVGAKWCTHDQRLYKHGDTFIDQQSHWIIHDLIPLTKITLTISLWCFLCLFIHGFSNII